MTSHVGHEEHVTIVQRTRCVSLAPMWHLIVLILTLLNSLESRIQTFAAFIYIRIIYVYVLNEQLMTQRFKVHFHFIGNLCIPLSLSLPPLLILPLWNDMYEKQPRIGDFRFWATRSQRAAGKNAATCIIWLFTCRHIIFNWKMKWLTIVMEFCVIWKPLSARIPLCEESNQINCRECCACQLQKSFCKL